MSSLSSWLWSESCELPRAVLTDVLISAYVSPFNMSSNALADPTAVLLELFLSSHDLNQFPSQVTAHFENVFSTNDALNQVPSYFHVQSQFTLFLTYFRFHLSMCIIPHMHTRIDLWFNSLPWFRTLLCLTNCISLVPAVVAGAWPQTTHLGRISATRILESVPSCGLSLSLGRIHGVPA